MRTIKGVVEDKDVLKGTLTIGGVEYVATEETRLFAATIPDGTVATLSVDAAFNIVALSPMIKHDRTSTAIPSPKTKLSCEGKDRLIVRQNCLAHADAMLSSLSNDEDMLIDKRLYFEFAAECERWVTR